MAEKIHINPEFSEEFTSISEIYQALQITNPSLSSFTFFQSRPVYVKSSSPIPFGRRLKNAFRSTGPWRRAPRIREFQNLLKLRERGIPAVPPLVAAENRIFGFLERQLLITERIVDSDSLFDLAFQKKLDQDQLYSINRKLGNLVGRMHNAGFCHRDLFLRNILVGINGTEPSFHFIDCHGGRWFRMPGRAFAYDLGCYEKWAATLFDVKTRGHFFAGYLEARPGVNIEKMLRLTNRARQRIVLRRLKRKRLHHKKRQHLEPLLQAKPLDPSLIFTLLNSRDT